MLKLFIQINKRRIYSAMNFLFKIIGLLLAIITPFASLIVTDLSVPFDKEIGIVEEKVGGYMKGVCHAEPQYDMLKDANIGWIRDDIPFAFNSDGSLSQSYINWKAETKAYADNGLKVMAITPYPEDFIEYGLDPRDPANKEAIQDIARFYLNDLKDIVGAFQITNEMGIDRFTLPLTLEEAADFIGMQLEAMYPDRGDIIIGYNLGGLAILQLPGLMKEYHKYCDYVGLDMYLGCFEPVLKNPNQYITILNFVRRITGKPIIMCEFGYIGLGEPKTKEEKQAILEGYGFSSEEEARENIDEFIANLPPDLADEFDKYADETPEYRASQMFDGEYSNHLYRELPDGYGLYGFPHTPEGQAEFFSYVIPKVRNLDYVVGSFIYCWEDSGDCYVCGQTDCPVETKWGLIDGEGNPKPSYYAVKEAFAD